MSCCILQIENHPDRLIEDVFGPYDSWEEAEKVAEEKEAHSDNFNAPYKHQLYIFEVREMIK